MSIFVDLSKDQITQIFGQYFMAGKALIAKNLPDTKFYKFLKGMATEDISLRNKFNEQLDEYNIFNTIEFIEEYETMLGIPDDCFTNDGDIETRQRQIIAKMLAYGTQTAQDLIDVVAILGFEIRVSNGTANSGFPVKFPWLFFGDASEAANTVVITFINVDEPIGFPIKFPWVFSGTGYVSRVKCFITKLIPSTDKIVFNFIKVA